MRSGYYNYYRVAPPAAAVMGTSLAGRLLGTEAQGLAIDFTDLSMVIRDTGTPANAFAGNPNNKLTYSSPSTKWILGSNGLYSSGTTLRTSYNASGTALGVLVEEARTNLVLRNTDMSVSPWSTFISGTAVSPTITAASGVAPDGTTTATLISLNRGAGNTSGDRCLVKQTVTVVNGSTYASSFFIKAFTAGDVGKDLSFVTEGAVPSGGVVTLTADWQRITPAAHVAASTSVNLVWQSRGGTTTSNEVAFLLWAPQFELGAFATSPILTDASTVTRAAERIQQAAGTFASGAGGTLFVMAMRIQDAINYPILVAIGTTSNDAVAIARYVSQRVGASVRVAAAFQADGATGAIITAGAPMIKAAYRYAANDFALYVNGAQVYTDTSGSVPAAGPLGIGGISADGGTIESVYIQKIMHVPLTFSNAELQAITT